MKILVAIANYGTKNRPFLDRLLSAYRSMRYDLTIVVLSDRPKEDLGPDIKVRVGVPTSNPMSLPFAHRALFAERANDFDLFIYTEDDTLIDEHNVDAFVRMNSLVPEGQIPGFMRYEVRPSGERSYCSVHSHFRWDPATARSHEGEVFASFTNAHSACFMLSREQLRAALDSGGFLVPPHDAVYGMLESAATDPYTRCGFERRIAISRIEEFLLPHLPNIYIDKLGASPDDFYAQLEALKDIAAGRTSGKVLVNPGSRPFVSPWSMHCYPRASEEIRGAVSGNKNSVLSVGMTAGILERELFGEAATIVGIPVDNVLAAVARLRRIETTAPDWANATREIRGREFDIVLLHDVLHRFPEPGRVLGDLRDALANVPEFVVTMPNWWHYRVKSALKRRPGHFPGPFSESGMHRPTWRHLTRWLRQGGLEIASVAFRGQGRIGSVVKSLPRAGRYWLSQELIVRAISAK